eukprot:TRINITY_DN18998_c0_g1_i1.p2 TRINITY_DN18998_c0_g1~~TRINITY_DN18998_c0_g1_i1.p2  ORF type:complete len:571 (+),score=203.81 TRINITY_DN18998_c0_g1_i1:78-1715(+)
MANWTDSNFKKCLSWDDAGRWTGSCNAYVVAGVLPDALPGVAAVLVLAGLLVGYCLWKVVALVSGWLKCSCCTKDEAAADSKKRRCKVMLFRAAVVLNALCLLACAVYMSWYATSGTAASLRDVRVALKDQSAKFPTYAAGFEDAVSEAALQYPQKPAQQWRDAARAAAGRFSSLTDGIDGAADAAGSATKWLHAIFWTPAVGSVAVAIAALANGHRMVTPCLLLLATFTGLTVAAAQIGVVAASDAVGSVCDDYENVGGAVTEAYMGCRGVDVVREVSQSMAAAYYNATCGSWPHRMSSKEAPLPEFAAALVAACTTYFDCDAAAARCTGAAPSAGWFLNSTALKKNVSDADRGGCSGRCDVVACATGCRAGSDAQALAAAVQGGAKALAKVAAAAEPLVAGTPLQELVADNALHSALCGDGSGLKDELTPVVYAASIACGAAVLAAVSAVLTASCFNVPAPLPLQKTLSTPRVVVGAPADLMETPSSCGECLAAPVQEDTPPAYDRKKSKEKKEGRLGRKKSSRRGERDHLLADGGSSLSFGN